MKFHVQYLMLCMLQAIFVTESSCKYYVYNIDGIQKKIKIFETMFATFINIFE